MSASSKVMSQEVRLSVSRKVLALDAITCLMMGAFLLGGKGFVSSLLGFPEDFIAWAGLVLIPCAAFIGFTSRAGTQTRPPHPMVWLVILGNAGWIIASLLAVGVWFAPNMLGIAFVLLQAVVVAIITALEYRGLRD